MEYCVENWSGVGLTYGRAVFSCASMLLQYVMPISIVTVSYRRICKKLRHRMVAKSQATQIERNREKAERSFRRTNKLLISISLIFGLSWLPLNLVNAFADLNSFDDRNSFLMIFALCHMVGMSSACSNPLLYGWLNETFRKEFIEVFACLRCIAPPATQAANAGGAIGGATTTMGGNCVGGSPESGLVNGRKRNSYERTETQLVANITTGVTDVVTTTTTAVTITPHQQDHHQSPVNNNVSTVGSFTLDNDLRRESPPTPTTNPVVTAKKETIVCLTSA